MTNDVLTILRSSVFTLQSHQQGHGSSVKASKDFKCPHRRGIPHDDLRFGPHLNKHRAASSITSSPRVRKGWKPGLCLFFSSAMRSKSSHASHVFRFGSCGPATSRSTYNERLSLQRMVVCIERPSLRRTVLCIEPLFLQRTTLYNGRSSVPKSFFCNVLLSPRLIVTHVDAGAKRAFNAGRICTVQETAAQQQ